MRGDNEEFEREFWAGRNLNELYADAAKRTDGAPMERIFASGMREFLKLRERRVADAGALLDGARRAMRASFQRELDAVESQPVLPRLGGLGVAPTSACSARCGGSCMPSSACRTCSR